MQQSLTTQKTFSPVARLHKVTAIRTGLKAKAVELTCFLDHCGLRECVHLANVSIERPNSSRAILTHLESRCCGAKCESGGGAAAAAATTVAATAAVATAAVAAAAVATAAVAAAAAAATTTFFANATVNTFFGVRTWVLHPVAAMLARKTVLFLCSLLELFITFNKKSLQTLNVYQWCEKK